MCPCHGDKERKHPAFVGLFERGSNESGDWTWIDGSNMSFELDNGTEPQHASLLVEWRSPP